MSASVVLCGGGTAGHVNPLIATAKAIAKADPTVRLTAVGTAGGLENELVPAAGIDLQLIERADFPRGLHRKATSFPLRFSRAIRQAGKILRQTQATCVVGFGGYASTPMYLAAARRGIPIVVHEANTVPGLANKLGAKLARVVALTFPSTTFKATRRGRIETVGLPLRPAISRLAQADSTQRQQLREQAAQRFGLDPQRPIVVVSGGSLGALRLNETMQVAGLALDAQILHITGKGKDEVVRAAVAGHDDYVVLDYLSEMEDAYAVADLLIARSGAGMVAEASSLGIPTIFVPLPIGNGEQARNAHDVAQAGGALIVDNADFTPQWVAENVPSLLDSAKLAEMSAAAKSIAPADAAARLASLIMEISEES